MTSHCKKPLHHVNDAFDALGDLRSMLDLLVLATQNSEYNADFGPLNTGLATAIEKATLADQHLKAATSKMREAQQ